MGLDVMVCITPFASSPIFCAAATVMPTPARSKAECLQGIGPHNGLYAALTGVAPNEQQHHASRNGKRHKALACQGFHHKGCDDAAHQKQARRAAREFAEQEKQRARAACVRPEALAQVGVDARQSQLIIKRQQHQRNDDIAHDKAEAHLQIGHSAVFRPARHRYKGYTRYAGANHAKGHHPPGRLTSGAEKSIVRLSAAPAAPAGNEPKYQKIGHEGEWHQEYGHR